jgi:F-type H+-transporting ATPase subunit gamma
MATLKEVRESLKTVSIIETITNIYQEMANFRMRKIREKVLRNREFIEGLFKVYETVKRCYLSFLEKKKIKEALPIKKLKKEIVVFLSVNEIFYGPLILDIWKEVLNYLKEKKADLVIVGKIGKYLAKRESPKIKFFYFDLDDDNPRTEEIKKIFDFIKDYEKIVIFHGKFETILTQKVNMTDISGKFEIEKEIGEKKEYLFEPSPEAVLKFFETEMMSGFFHHAILEHRLARYATRMVAMYRAAENARKEIKKLKAQEKKLKAELLNKRQIELFSNLATWKK